MSFNIKKDIIQCTRYVSEDVFTHAAALNIQKACNICMLLLYFSLHFSTQGQKGDMQISKIYMNQQMWYAIT
jgi:hypothetical protein